MDELVNVMEEILIELRDINGKLDDIQGCGLYNSIADIHEKLGELCGNGIWNSLSDVCDKLDNVESAISSLETTIDFK